MKKDWTYKKLGEVCDINYGTRVVQKKDGGSIYPVYGGGGATFRMDTYNREDCLVVARFAMSPKCTRIVKGKFFLNDSGLTLDAHEELYQDYLNWHIISLNDEIYQTAKGAAQKNLDVKAFTSLKIAIPPLSIQRSIVAELDLLHSVISKKKEQLRELDNLAQSLFYQMFGDPISNPMGWQVKKLGEVVADDCPLSYGIVQPGDHVPNGVPVVRPVDLISNFVYKKNLKCTSQEIANSYKRTILKGDELLMCVRGTTGVVAMATPELKGGNTTRGITPMSFDSNISKWFVFYLLKTSSMQQLIASLTYGIALKQINMKDVRNLPVILPPLSLQQSFAAKVSAIEAQKQAITQSIKETEALLAQRMDTYFS